MSVPTTQEELTRWLVGESEVMRNLREMILRLAPRSLPIWIEGETGVGKELVAQALHAASGRGGAMVAFNVCAISESMFEDALFGHVRGAFTGAMQDTRGYLGEADGGTLFLDEVSGLTIGAQAKLLRALETKTYRPVGGRIDRRSDFRVVVASNESLSQLIDDGRFRSDLAFRLRGAVLQVPPLRARTEDVAPLVRHFLIETDAGETTEIHGDAIVWLEGRTWLGNVRELRQVIHCARALSPEGSLRERDVAAAHRMMSVERAQHRSTIRSDGERNALVTLLERAGWDTAAAADELKVDRTTVYRRLRRLGIELPPSRREPWTPHGRVGGADGVAPAL